MRGLHAAKENSTSEVWGEKESTSWGRLVVEIPLFTTVFFHTIQTVGMGMGILKHQVRILWLLVSWIVSMIFLCSGLFGEMIQIDEHIFSNGLKPPTRIFQVFKKAMKFKQSSPKISKNLTSIQSFCFATISAWNRLPNRGIQGWPLKGWLPGHLSMGYPVPEPEKSFSDGWESTSRHISWAATLLNSYKRNCTRLKLFMFQQHVGWQTGLPFSILWGQEGILEFFGWEVWHHSVTWDVGQEFGFQTFPLDGWLQLKIENWHPSSRDFFLCLVYLCKG